jgi:outer membrane protein assembly factor BamB
LAAAVLCCGCAREPELIQGAPEEVLPVQSGGPAWPRFHGLDGCNVSTEKGLLRQWPEGGPALLWTAKGIGQGYAGVTVAGSRLFTAGNRGSHTVLSALDTNGTVVWQATNGPAWTKEYPGTRGTPTVDGDRVYHESPSGRVACWNVADGSEEWSVNILDQFEGKNIQWGLSESLLVDGDRVICCPGALQASVAALDKRSGATVWAAPDSGDRAGYAAPVLVTWEGRRMVLAMTSAALIAVDANSGELLFRHEHATEYDVNATMPVYRDGKILISSGYGSGAELLALRADGAAVSVEPVWKSDDLDNHHGGIALLGDHVYGCSHHGKWVCLEWAKGRSTYAERGVGKGSLTIADGMLYMLSEKGQVGLAVAEPAGLRLVGKFSLPTAGEDFVWAHPVVCGGRLYVRHGDRLYAYDVRDPNVAAHPGRSP